MKICPKCKTQLKDDALFCVRCGTSLAASEKKYCPRCNAEIKSDDAVFCRTCGFKFDEENAPVVRVSDNISKICCYCGYLLPDDNARFCKKCGGEFNDNNQPLPLGDNNKYYRICKHCGMPYEIRMGVETCKKCGTKLDPKPRTSPKLTEEEENKIRQRIEKERKLQEQKEEAERKKREAERLVQEREEKIRKEKEYILKQRRIATRKKVLTIIRRLVLLVILCIVVGCGIWILIDNNNIKKAEAALGESDYTQALELYGKINSRSRYYEQAQKRIVEINEAVKCCEDAQKSIDKPAFLDAMEQCKKAKEYNTGMPLIDELYATAQNGVADYINKLINEEDYKNALAVVNKINAEDRNEAVKTVETTIMNKVQSYYDNGNKMLSEGSLDTALTNLNAARDIDPGFKDGTNLSKNLAEAYVEQANAQYNAGSLETALVLARKADSADSCYLGADVKNKVAANFAQTAQTKFNEKNMTEALNYANKALDASDTNEVAKKVKSDAETYNKYVEMLNRAGGQYSRWEISNAHDTLSDVPTDTIGNMARANFTTLISNINNDYEYRNNPVIVSGQDASFTKIIYNTSYVNGSVWGWIENRLNRPVTVSVKFKVKQYDDNYRYKTYTVGAKESIYVSQNFNNVYCGYRSSYSYNIYIDDYTVN